MRPSEEFLQLEKLTKRYRALPIPAIDGISLTVHSGEAYGFLGSNGAGKSTTIRTLLNFLQPTSGRATILGHDSVTQSVLVKKYVGYLSGEVALYGQPTAEHLLRYLTTLQPLKHTVYFKNLIDRFEITMHQPIVTLSKGNRQKIGIVQAFMHEPEVLILDEPTSGLDPLMQEEFFKLIRECKNRGAAIFFSSHNLSEVQKTCDKVGIIKRGKLIREHAISEIGTVGNVVFKVRFRRLAGLDKLFHDPNIKLVSRINDHTLLLQPRSTIAPALASLSSYDIDSMSTEQNELEDEFIKFYEDPV